jgi:hypothetical protein
MKEKFTFVRKTHESYLSIMMEAKSRNLNTCCYISYQKYEGHECHCISEFNVNTLL